MITPRITNKLRGSLGEIYYKEYCDQTGWAYTSLENLYAAKTSQWIFTFKKGFHRIQVSIPKEIRSEISMIVKPTNNSIHSPSFVFDFLACKVGTSKIYSGVKTSDTFVWVESKTGPGIFSASQVNAMSKIKLPLAIFQIVDILESPKSIRMGSEMKAGKEWLEDLQPIDNEIYEFDDNARMKKKVVH